MGLMKRVKMGIKDDIIKKVALKEDIDEEKLMKLIADGKVIIPKNEVRENLNPIGIGEGLTTKVNVNVGTSNLHMDPEMEIRKAEIAVKFGADTIMDLSTGGDLDDIRRELMRVAPIPFGTVPIYQAFIEATIKKGAGINMTEDDIFNTIEKQLRDGVDFMTIHAGITREIVEKALKTNRVAGIVSRGGAMLAAWMIKNNSENPLYKSYGYLMELLSKYDATISIGDALRPGSIIDAHDYLQMAEMLTVSRLVEEAWRNNVQVMVEGPGHMPLNQIEANIKLEKQMCKGSPYYVLGPLTTDIGAGYDHIVSAIGAAIAAASGADIICYLTPSEHLGLPNEEDVREGLIAAKLAAHSGDIVKLGEKALKKDLEISIARTNLDWEKMYKLSLNPEKAKEVHERYGLKGKVCTMCGEYCVYKILKINQ
ncbi:MAG: phosphomethylpyrimidine synthase ThiC [Candidatus Methanomethylicia archaeon]